MCCGGYIRGWTVCCVIHQRVDCVLCDTSEGGLCVVGVHQRVDCVLCDTSEGGLCVV